MHLPPDAVPRTTLPPIRRWKVVTGVSLVALLTAAVVIGLWWAGTRGLDGKDLVAARMDALRVGLSLGIGGGGVFALYLAWRRQRATEADLDNRERALAHQLAVFTDTKAHQERVAAATESDAEARRITDLYTKAVEQLGSDKAPVRLGGLYALERLAQDNVSQRQTIVNVLCAYLRMPFHEPGDDGQEGDAYWQRVQELEVRTTAQRILATHLRPGETHWADSDLDLTGATLVDLDFDHCHVRTARFANARFTGPAGFHETRFDGATSFKGARFSADAGFHEARFAGNAEFREARFDGRAVFSDAHFDSSSFTGAVFGKLAFFRKARFTEPIWFQQARFGGMAGFRGAHFTGTAGFGHVTFDGIAEFDEVEFLGTAEFDHARFEDVARFKEVPFSRGARFVAAVFRGSADFDGASFARDARFTDAEFLAFAGFAHATFAVAPDLGGASFSAAVPAELASFT